MQFSGNLHGRCTTVRTLSSRRVSSQRPYDVITVLDTWIQKFY
ncbi:hypothetical protein [Wolbachia endosymbiont of Rhagoletis cerasi]|nr:hypothetical protein [Wolbachia endosymbiont of Rhagoletis cerasi]